MGTISLQSPKLNITMSATVRNALTSTTTVSGQVIANISKSMANGVSANQSNRAWTYVASLASGADITIDLYDFASVDAGAGAGKDILGQTLIMEEIVSILIENKNSVGDAGQLEIIPAPSNGWSPIGSHTVATGGALRGGGALLKFQPDTDGFDVTDLSNHKINLAASGGAVDYSITILGRHDDDESSSSSSESSSSSSSTSSSSESSSSLSSSSSSSSS